MRWIFLIPLLLGFVLQGCGGKLGNDSLHAEGVFYGQLGGSNVVLVLHGGDYFLLAGDLVAKGTYAVNGLDLTSTGAAYDLALSGAHTGDMLLSGVYKTNKHVALSWSVAGTNISGQVVVESSSIYDIPWSIDQLVGGWINQDESNLVFFTLNPPLANASLKPDGGNNDLIISANISSTDYDGVSVSMIGDLGFDAAEWAEYDAASKNLVIHIDLLPGTPSTANDVIAALLAEGHFKGELDKKSESGNDGSGHVQELSATLVFPGNEGELLVQGAILSSLTQMDGTVSDDDDSDNIFNMSMSFTSVGGDPGDLYEGFAVLSDTVVDGAPRAEMLVLTANSQTVFLNKLLWVSQDELNNQTATPAP